MRYSPALNLLSSSDESLDGALYGVSLPESREMYPHFRDHLSGYALEAMGNRHIFIRHGDAENNQYTLCYAHPELARWRCSLTAQGRERIQTASYTLLPSLLGRKPVIITSPFLRARESAEILQEATGAGALIVSEALRERFFGEFDLRSTHGVGASVYELDKVDPYHTYYGVESVMQVLDRITRDIVSMDSLFEGQAIVWVSHLYPLQILRARKNVALYFEGARVQNGESFSLEDLGQE